MATPHSNNITNTHSKTFDPKTLAVHPVESPSACGDHQANNGPVFLKVVKGFMDIMVDGLSPWVKSERKVYDLIVVGGGYVGLTAAIHTASMGIDTLVIERIITNGPAGLTECMDCSSRSCRSQENREMPEQKDIAERHFQFEVLRGQAVTSIRTTEGCHIVGTENGDEYRARALLLAPGTRYRRLSVPGEEDFIGAGIHFCATCDGALYEGQDVLVATDYGDSGVEKALSLTKFTNKVILLEVGDCLWVSQQLQERAAAHPKLEIRLNTMVWEFQGSGRLNSVIVKDMNTSKNEELETSALFVFVGLEPNTEFARGVVEVDRWGFIKTDRNMETSLKGVFAAGGSCRSSSRQIVDSDDEGAVAALTIRQYLEQCGGSTGYTGD